MGRLGDSRRKRQGLNAHVPETLSYYSRNLLKHQVTKLAIMPEDLIELITVESDHTGLDRCPRAGCGHVWWDQGGPGEYLPRRDGTNGQFM